MTIELTERETVALHGGLLTLAGMFNICGEKTPEMTYAKGEIEALLAKVESNLPADFLTTMKSLASVAGLPV